MAKTVAAFITRSASMAAEAVHSWVDAGNSILILAAERTARRPADEEHPLGFGRASYVWSLFASLGMFALGAVATFWHGVTGVSLVGERTQSELAYTLRDLEKRIRQKQELIGMVVLTLATPDEEEATL